ncbi:hypothetical protein N7495_007573 [Penicillium taxi]|uniref:uncharacterized protein n=1 Tax=Penicillium taxi TaxID=168475 RepID=UPI0025453115|nr:uncharacterized protein N7495_007573 [Penicillium taxi]KAJ5887532.1 hypothetical protein N7495_007573 [Penicillium taxi]
MATRGNLSDYRSPSHDTLRNGMPSPRIQHFAGEVPPALSPLDAFAAQGRLLARQLDESRQMDRRMSRLPPSSVARSLSRGRPNFFRSPASESHADGLARRNTTKQNFEVEEPKYRPVSEHPRFSSMSQASSISNISNADYDEDDTTPRTTMISVKPVNYVSGESFEEESTPVGMAFTDPSHPFEDSSRLHVPQKMVSPMPPNSRPSSSAQVRHESCSDDDNSSSNAGSTFSKPRKLSSGSAASVPYSPMSYPVRQHPRSPSISSETSNSYLARPSFNFSRPLSRSSTSLSAPGAPESHAPPPAAPRHQPHTMHRASRPTPILLPLATEEAAATVPAEGDPSSAVSSYVYAKYDLPRGRMVSRDSVVFAGLQTPHFEWQEPLFENSPPRVSGEHPRSARTPPPSNRILDYSPKPHSMHEVPVPTHVPEPVPVPSLTPERGRELRKARTVSPSSPNSSLAPAMTSLAPALTTPERPSRPSTESTRSTKSTPPPQKANVKTDTVQPDHVKSDNVKPENVKPENVKPENVKPENVKPENVKLENVKPDNIKPDNIKPDNTSSTDVAKSLRSQTGSSHGTPATLSADDHVTQGIELHEKGSLSESTYHLRIAAKQSHPTGMLMYALACRHGWGMRPNQQEGVRWLRKAVDSVGLEMLANPDAPGASKAKELHKAYRAQFALSIYELGVSYLNGWGIDQNKPLALRCFEIASQWGDVDAMAEAGYCYAEGIGTKKDMKKAAHFYRDAESHGMSMVGTSWIYKDKYMGDDSKDSKEPKESRKTRTRGRTVSGDKKPRSKSRTRSMFQRKKSVVDN